MSRLSYQIADFMNNSESVRIHSVELLSDNWYVLKKTTFDLKRRDGTWQTQSRETYDRGNGATILLYNRERQTVVLTRQFRYPAYVNGCVDGMLIEACAGLLDREEPETCIRREVEEETGYQLSRVSKLFEAYMSPGSVTEKLHFFAAEYETRPDLTQGGGDTSEGEDIEILEMTLDEALRKVTSGEIQDGKTILLLQYAKLTNLLA